MDESKKPDLDDPRTRLQDLCMDLIEHVQLLRDFGTTPGNVWLARSELTKVNQLAAEIEQLLEEIKQTVF